jgi:hypothetical protein
MPTFTHDAANHYFSGQGVVMIGRKDPITGEPLGLRPVGNVPDMRITVGTTVVEHKGSQDGQRATDARLQTETKVSVTITMENWIAENVAKALRGANAIIAGGSVTAETAWAYPGLVTGLKYIKVSAVVVKKGAIVLVPYTDGVAAWDYKLNEQAGSIMLNDGIAPNAPYSAYVPPTIAADGSELSFAYTYATQFVVDSLTEPMNDSWLRFEGLNTVEENSPVIVDIFRFANDPLKELALLSDTFGQFVLEGSVLKDDSRPSGTSKYFSIKKLD